MSVPAHPSQATHRRETGQRYKNYLPEKYYCCFFSKKTQTSLYHKLHSLYIRIFPHLRRPSYPFCLYGHYCRYGRLIHSRYIIMSPYHCAVSPLLPLSALLALLPLLPLKPLQPLRALLTLQIKNRKSYFVNMFYLCPKLEIR
jgi:hypothetical protein